MTPLEELLLTLDLDVLEQNLFRGVSPQFGWQRVFGGQVIAQALVAANRTVEAARPVHSLHGYFILPGDPKTPIIYEVDRIRDGGSFTTRRVVAIQHGRPIFAMSASFHGQEEGLSHAVQMPDVPAPEELPGEQELAEHIVKFAAEPMRRYWERPRALVLRPTDLGRYLGNKLADSKQYVWVKVPGEVAPHEGLQRAILAYLSDMTLLDTALIVHGKSVFDSTLQVASLDHAMWFHRTPAVGEWMLYAQDSPWTGGARGFTRGSLFSREGALIASVAQEGLIRRQSR